MLYQAELYPEIRTVFYYSSHVRIKIYPSTINITNKIGLSSRFLIETEKTIEKPKIFIAKSKRKLKKNSLEKAREIFEEYKDE